MPKIKELADTLGVSAQTIRDYVKSEFGIVPQERKPIILDANQAAIVADHFKNDSSSLQEVAKTPANPASYDELVDLKVENAMLKERVAGLEEKVRLLEDRLSVADAALERQQNISGGFWSRLGRKLLGEGKKQAMKEGGQPVVTYEEQE